MQETPHKAGQKIDQVIDRLNTRWDLQIPRLHGLEAKRAGNCAELGRKCSSRIRALCWRDNVNIDGVIEDFEEKAAQKHSDWIYKPSQQPGTLPSRPITKSFLRRDALSKSRLTPQNRLELVQILAELLEDEYKLATDSDTYQRTSFTSDVGASTSTTFTSCRSTSTRSSTVSKSSYTTACHDKEAATTPRISSMAKVKKEGAHSTSPKKREAPRPLPKSAKRSKTEPEKRQLTLSQTSKRLKARLSAHSRDLSPSNRPRPRDKQFAISRDHQSRPQNTSFDTVPSDDDDSVFSDAQNLEPCSNNTSILSDIGGSESCYSGGTQLEKDFLHEPSVNRSFRAADSFTTSARDLLEKLPTDSPFKIVKRQLLKDHPYWYVFELSRISLHLGCDAVTVANKITERTGEDTPEYARFWKEVIDICKEEKATVPVRSRIKEWTHQDDRYLDETSGRSVQLSARLEFSKIPDKNLFDLKLSPIEIGESCRFHRKYGADRFLVLDTPSFAPGYPKYLPGKLKCFEAEEIHRRVFSWLGTTDLYLAGRIWRAFYVEPKDVKKKKKRKEEGSRLKVHLFAVHGFDFASPTSKISTGRHQPLSLLELIQWHLPLFENIESTDLKLFARIHLGLSKTTPTVTLEPSEFIYVPDKRSPTGEVMNDGCSLISERLGLEIWKMIARPGEPMPCVFQARIGGAKGLWVVDDGRAHSEHVDKVGRGFWIEVNDSQLKIKPHPRHRADADVFQRTFEVVKHSQVCSPAHLNTQLITILENRGVTRDCLREVLLAELAEYYEKLTQALKEGRVALRRFRQTYHPSKSGHSDMTWYGELPDDRGDELDMLLESGFEPAECRYMIGECLKKLVSRYIETRMDKLWIPVSLSTNIFCIPDPVGVLQPGEAQINFSQPVSEFPNWELDGRKALVARNPAHLPSDIQSVTLVRRPELRHLPDVIIFPTQGNFPLAGMLSGGDYDGDTVTVIWDERITDMFESIPLQSLASKEECGVESQAQYVKDVFPTSQPTSEQLNQFMQKCCAFNGMSSRLGEVTKLLEKVVYANAKNLMTDEANKLASLAGYLVDAAKQGYSLSNDAWSRLRREIMTTFELPKLPDTMAYDDDNAVVGWISRSTGIVNILDYLKFDVAKERSKEILTEFNDIYVPEVARDKDLDEPHQKAWARAERANCEERKATKALIIDLKARIGAVYDEWRTKFAKNEAMKNRRDTGRDVFMLDVPKLAEELAEAIAAIEPPDSNCYIYHDFREDGGGKGSDWSILKASTIYHMYHTSNMPWKLVGEEMCHIKLSALRKRGVRVRGMTQDIRDRMRFNTKERLTDKPEAVVVEDDAEEEMRNIVEE